MFGFRNAAILAVGIFLLTSLAITRPFELKAQASQHPSAQYSEVQRKLAQGWNTWMSTA